MLRLCHPTRTRGNSHAGSIGRAMRSAWSLSEGRAVLAAQRMGRRGEMLSAERVSRSAILRRTWKGFTMKASQLKINLRPGSKLSEHFTNRRDCYKVVEIDNVLGYVVSSGGRESAACVYPLYRADIHVKVGKTWHIVSSYEQGERLNDYTFYMDYEGCTFATIASQAISALEERHRIKPLAPKAASSKKTPSRKKTRKKAAGNQRGVARRADHHPP